MRARAHWARVGSAVLTAGLALAVVAQGIELRNTKRRLRAMEARQAAAGTGIPSPSASAASPAAATASVPDDSALWPPGEFQRVAVAGDPPPPFPSVIPGFTLEHSTTEQVRAFTGGEYATINDYPHTMNGCNNQRFHVRWRALNEEAVVEATYGYDPNNTQMAEPPVRGRAGWLATHGCAQPGFRLISAGGSTLTDVVVEVQQLRPRV